MSQNQLSLNGGREEITISPNNQPGVFLSNQYVEVKRLAPIPTEWGSGGRPIYDRLPSASERYKVNFSYDGRLAYTYIPRNEGFTGPTSMYVQATGENKYLVIQAGNIVWEYGTIKTNPVLIDIELVGMGSARYLIAYQLYYDDSPIQAQYKVTDMELSGFTLDIRSGTDSVLGWRYSPQYAFAGNTERMWSNYDGMFPSYSQDAYLSWQLSLPCSFSKITLRCPTNTSYTGTATLSYMTCPDSTEEFCTNPNWQFEETVSVSVDEDGQYYEFNLENPAFCKGWKVEWSDPTVSIYNVLVSGTVTQEKAPATMYTNYGLVAYPQNSVPQKFVNSSGKEVPITLCKLAYVDVNSAFTVEKVQDVREVVYTPYEPIADWLTRPWDDNLKDLYGQFSNFPEFWMNPTTCMDNEYSKLSESGIEVSFDRCPSPRYTQY